MKKITITNAFSVETKVRHSELKDVFAEGTEEMEASDGYHTFGELYDHRIALFVVLCNFIYQMYGSGIKNAVGGTMVPWKSKKHHDGTSWDGWFIAGIGIDKGSQISYHLPLSMWDKLRVVAYDNAPEWDGHTSQDVLSRLLKLLDSD